jgi:Lipid A Biosynthesis N-terminal domain
MLDNVTDPLDSFREPRDLVISAPGLANRRENDLGGPRELPTDFIDRADNSSAATAAVSTLVEASFEAETTPMRFVVQWIASERAGKSVVPTAFWVISIGGGLMLLGYAVFMLGQIRGLFVYLRNLQFVIRSRSTTRRHRSYRRLRVSD